MTAPGDLPCVEVVELVTAYLEGQLDAAEAERFERHLGGCEGCTAYLEQMRATIAAAGTLPAVELPPELQQALREAFRRRSAG